MLKSLALITLAPIALTLTASAAVADPLDTPNRPGAPVVCDGRLDPQFNAIKADAALSEAERELRLKEVWETCSPGLMDAIGGLTRMAADLSVDTYIDAAIGGADADVAAAHADAAVAGVKANSADPDHRVTNALVAQYHRERGAAD